VARYSTASLSRFSASVFLSFFHRFMSLFFN
jgi:hypothetical protein